MQSMLEYAVHSVLGHASARVLIANELTEVLHKFVLRVAFSHQEAAHIASILDEIVSESAGPGKRWS